MAEVILMPRLSDTMTEGVIAAWHKNVGDAVKKGDVLAEIETDKATMELESYKNLALRMDERMEWKLSPAYDMAFDAGPGGCHQTSVMGEARHPAREHLLALARACDVPKATALRCIDVVCDVAQTLDALLDEGEVRKATRRAIGCFASSPDW